MFTNNNKYYEDIRVIEMDLSVRSYNALTNNGYEYASQVLNLDIETFNNIKNLGAKSKDEIIKKLKNYIYIEYEDVNEDRIDLVVLDKLSSTLVEEYNKSYFDVDLSMLKENFNIILKRSISEINLEADENNFLKHDEYIEKIYSNSILLSIINKHILTILGKTNEFIGINEIRNTLPNHLKYSIVIENIIIKLVKENVIENIDDKFRIWYPNLKEYIETLQDERIKYILLERCKGHTLQAVAEELEITRERVRQIEIKAIEKIPRLREDDFKELYKMYDWTFEIFKYLYDVDDLTYGYLKLRYEKGSKSIDEILENQEISLQVRKKAEQIIFKDYIFIGSSKIKKDRAEILDYILRTYCRDEVTIKDMLDLYDMFLEDYGLHNNEEFRYPQRYFEAALSGSKKVLWKYGKKLRYYDLNQIEEAKIINALNLEKYENVEYSALKFFTDYKDIMEELDIRDEYELHNLMKKVIREDNRLNITFLRMPNIEFGKADRDMQMLDVLLQTAPISSQDLAKEYEKMYGVKAETVLGSYTRCIDEYYYEGMFTIDSEALSGEEFDKMKFNLDKDIYIINDIRNMYTQLFPQGDSKLINPYNLKRLGFRLSSNIIYREEFINIDSCFRKILTENDIFDLKTIDSRITTNQCFYISIQTLKNQFEIVEFSPSKYINIRRLKENGINKEKLKSYIDSVYEFVGQEIFTIKSLRNSGFEHDLDDLGFEDWFYASLLSCDQRFKSRKLNKNIILKSGNEIITINDLVEQIVTKYRSIDIYDFIDYMIDKYGIKIDKAKLMQIAREKDLYYDTIMEKIYIDYDEYFEEV
nr:DNA-directed RNA polymerase subunit alpha C-terminal domain-containing protein [uncultured Romboutsia sp.]